MSEASKQILREAIPNMEGWLTPDRAIEMYDLVLEARPLTVVEIGVFAGRSLLAQALALKDNEYGKLYGIDPWKVEAALEGEEDKTNRDWWSCNVDLEQMHRLTMQAIWKYNLDEYAIIIRSASQHVAGLFPLGIGVLLIDGNHSQIASCRDVSLFVPQVVEGGYVWMDDCDWPSTLKAQQLMMKWCREERVSADGHYKLYRRNKDL